MKEWKLNILKKEKGKVCGFGFSLFKVSTIHLGISDSHNKNQLLRHEG